MCDHFSLIPEIALAIFAGIGSVFTYRAWKQREDDLHEKYFERRYELFKTVSDAVGKAIAPSGADWTWFAELSGIKERVGFLFGDDAEKQFVELFDLLIEYQGALEIEESAIRVAKVKNCRELATKKSNELRRMMAIKIHINR